MTEKLRRSRSDKLIGGVCGGIGEYFNVDPIIVRLVFIFFMFLSVTATSIIYVVLWIALPESDNLPQKAPGRNVALGIILIILGGLLLFNQFYNLLSFAKLWPLVLILLGVYLIAKKEV